MISIDLVFTLFFLVLLQAVLGFDNLLYISLESKKAPKDKQATVRRIAIGIAIFLRIALLFILLESIKYLQDPIFKINFTNVIEGSFNVHSLIVLLGGIFLIFTAIKEIKHMLALEDHEEEVKAEKSVTQLIIWIAIVNLVFSFDSILTAMALTDVFSVMIIAIIIGGLLMIYLADTISEFLQRNRMYEVLGLFILLIVGIMLLGDGAHLAHLYLFGNEVTPMSKTTFYFVVGVLIAIDVVQSRYQRVLKK
ncbi:MAG: tellurium resistance protein TerC [Candidatus Marinimicrobia bacterium]|nr:tellurium resistance protein TerC [Candidatus Neomarinimicrobiota bacterium]|tara:strand:+ start:728 stop:1480 length:753 start_codon:yes stop_codon:yes gene_type:complete